MVSLILIFAFACAGEEKYIGTYKPTEKSLPEFSDICVELKKDGKGIRRAHDKEHFFEWEVKGREIRIHTRAGGILVAKMRHGILEVSLPGSKIIYLKRVE